LEPSGRPFSLALSLCVSKPLQLRMNCLSLRSPRG